MYTKIEETNITTEDAARPGDPVVVVTKVAGEDVLTLQANITNEEAEPVGRLYEVRGELWFALALDFIRESNIVDRAAQVSASAYRAAGWDM